MITTLVFDVFGIQMEPEIDDFTIKISKRIDIEFDKVYPIVDKFMIQNEEGKITEEKYYIDEMNFR